MQLEGSQYKQTDPSNEELKEYLKNLTVQLNQNKSREKREAMWCTLCKLEGHHKNECLTFAQYLEVGFPNTFPIGGPWFEIYTTHGNDCYHFPMMQKKKKEPKSTFYKFCKSVGHEDKNCRTLDLIKEITLDVYRI
jgi:hypothetical protein